MSSLDAETDAATIRDLKQTIIAKDLEISTKDLEIIELKAALEQAQAGEHDDVWGQDDSSETSSDQGYESVSSRSSNGWCEEADALVNEWASPAEEAPTKATVWTPDVESQDEFEKRIGCQQCDAMKFALTDNRDGSLKSRSRLEDRDFYFDPISSCHISFDHGLARLNTCYRSAQDTLFDAFGKHWPAEQRLHYPHGPRSVKFGKAELEPVFGDRDFVKNTANMCGDVAKGYDAMWQVISLRNAICHPEQHSPRTLDKLMQHAQSLAVNLGDEEQAFFVRERRDELQNLVRESFATIEKGQALALTAGEAPRWAMHHQEMFNHIRNHGLDSAKWSKVVLLAAHDWCEKNTYPGLEDPEYRANVEKAQAMMYEIAPATHDRFEAMLDWAWRWGRLLKARIG
ncbi:unnamed protein product [Zymoseptoria tritici ST99CH_3D1]|uniref:Uncharacterized protein n=1 Tax=Zymoseptoria tritici (strain ST99CH_3D7) TaxID=1276538 RepID=A0A1X7S3I2_ZYMT9|nr:unnamed protein product [Zymoseptoria tritici ST99CH_3D7]SMR61628.1 unnamed protein product [Zymoseptoria tritici ST99CH_3D1]